MSQLIEIDVAETPGWRFCTVGTASVWFKGYLHDTTVETIAQELLDCPADCVGSLLNKVDGHFGLIWQDGTRTIAAEDPIGSIPISFRQYDDGRIRLSGTGRRLLLPNDRPDPKSATVMAMAGFTLGSTTLYPDIKPVGCGRFVRCEVGRPLLHARYHSYQPSNTGPPSTDALDEDLLESLQELTLKIVEKTAASTKGRTIIAPLSAGLDSRLIVSALKEIDYPNVVCISYGRQGNHEAVAARKIAQKLGYDWHFIPHFPLQQAKTFSSEACTNFVSALADNLQAVPFQQDFHAVGQVKELGIASEDAVFINGQSGDFIAGNHIPKSLFSTPTKTLFEAFSEKHFSMWDCLKTPENNNLLRAIFKEEVAEQKKVANQTLAPHALYEAIEYENRQSKYVVAGQRTYEWHGFDWRLPLWDRAYIDFWEQVPLSAKMGQSLYKAMLLKANWGGVWGQDWIFRQNIVPIWMRPLRLMAKALHAPFGRSAWHRFEKNWIAWHTDEVSNYAVAAYNTVRKDTRGHRNAIAWHLDKYLSEKDIRIQSDGSVRLP